MPDAPQLAVARPESRAAGRPARRTPLGARPVLGPALRVLGELLLTVGAVLALFVVYELEVTDLVQAHTQHRLYQDLERSWRHPAGRPATPATRATAPAIPKVAPGQGFALLHIPRLGPHYAPVIVEGVSTADLQEGPGHYPGTALPGQVGNFVVSGHRTTYGRPFFHLDELRPGDPIVVELRSTWVTYRVTGSEIVDPGDLAVIAPVPDRPGRRPHAAMLTFTTCNPRYSARTRLVVHAALVATTPKSAGRPAGLAG